MSLISSYFVIKFIPFKQGVRVKTRFTFFSSCPSLPYYRLVSNLFHSGTKFICTINNDM